MQKKRITISIILIILITLMVYWLTQIKTVQNKPKEIAKASYNTTIGTEMYGIDHAITAEPNIPALSAGMIPVKYDEEKEEWIITENNENWYDYGNGKPAYIMLNDGVYQSELLPDMTGKKLAKDYVGNDALVVPLDGTIYMWIPRYAYNKEGEIIYIKQEYTVAGTYTMPEIFTYETENDNAPNLGLAGIWVEYNALENESEVTTKINNMTGEYNTYGFIANTIATNAKDESSDVGNDALVVPWKNILDLNTNRTILKVINTNKQEPIKAKAYRNEEEKIKIEVTYSANDIEKILDENGNILSENSTTAVTVPNLKGEGIYKYIIIDNIGNLKEVKIKVENVFRYQIPDLETLELFRDTVNAGNTYAGKTVEVVADIDMSTKYGAEVDLEGNGIKKEIVWTPIGMSDATVTSNVGVFSGIFNGNYHTISNLYMNDSNMNTENINYYKNGFFTYTKSSTVIKNLILKDVNIKTIGNAIYDEYCGIIVGANHGLIYNCGVDEGIIKTISNPQCASCYVGGIAGYNEGIIENCYNRAKIDLSTNKIIYAGGITGVSKKDIKNCYSIKSITAKGATVYAGGISGCNTGYRDALNANIINTYSISPITTTGTASSAGIVGWNGWTSTGYKIGTITNSYCSNAYSVYKQQNTNIKSTENARKIIIRTKNLCK